MNLLNEELLMQTRVKDGAENLLLDAHISVSDPSILMICTLMPGNEQEKERLEIQSELEVASNRINYIKHQMDLRESYHLPWHILLSNAFVRVFAAVRKVEWPLYP